MHAATPTTGLLLSGGLDSAILLGRLLVQGERVQPFYIRSDVVWQPSELAAVRAYLAVMASPRLAELVVLELPLADLYRDHWSVTGNGTPGESTPDEAVYLPGRNALLIIKAALWCQMRGIRRLALAPLGTSPFADAQDEFMAELQSALVRGASAELSLERPFAGLDKRQVMELGREFPLGLTFSCIAPSDGLHCGRCNKCGERKAAFASIGRADPTRYA